MLGELGEQEENGSKEERKAACVVIDSMRDWGYAPINLIPAGHGIVEQIGFQLRVHGIIPDEEENDALIAAEAALLGCSILLSSDHHLLEANEHPRFHEILQSHHVDGDHLVIAKPRSIVTKFYRRR